MRRRSKREAGDAPEHPRDYLSDPTQFGRDPTARWYPAEAPSQVPALILAYWQHLAACTLREVSGQLTIPADPVDRLAERLEQSGTRPKVDRRYLRRQLCGEYRASIEQLLGWAIAMSDVSVITNIGDVGSIRDLLPPGAEASLG